MRPERSFEELPPEILLLIFENLITPSYVFSLIRASPVAFRVFQRKKVAVLGNVIRRSIHPAVLPLAITVCDAARDTSFSVCSMAWEKAKKECHDPDYAYFSLWLRAFYKYIYRTTSAIGSEIRLRVKAADTAYDIDFRLQDLSLVLSLCRLWCATEFFIRDYPAESFQEHYANEATNKRPKSASSLSGNADLGLSKSEYGRLQRGLFHFELYRHLFGAVNRHRWLSEGRETNSTQHYMFMSCLTEAEKGELFSIQQHLGSRMNVELTSIYCYLVSKIEDLPRRKFQFMSSISTPKARLKRSAFKQFDIVDTALTELGLPFIQTFIKMGFKERLAVVKLCASQRREPKVEPYSRSYNGNEWTTARCAKYSFFHQLQQRKQSKLMARLTHEGRSEKSVWPLKAITFDSGYKAFGYFFWDDTRRYDLRIIYIQFRGTASPYTREHMVKRLVKVRAGLADARDVLPDVVLEMKDLLEIIESLEY